MLGAFIFIKFYIVVNLIQWLTYIVVSQTNKQLVHFKTKSDGDNLYILTLIRT